MRERGVVFGAPMITKTRKREKTQTRRVLDLEGLKVNLRHPIQSDMRKIGLQGVPGEKPIYADVGMHPASMNQHGAVYLRWEDKTTLGVKPGEFDFVCPYADGHTYLRDLGDRKVWSIQVHPEQQIWVKETWQTRTTITDCDVSKIVYAADYGGQRPGFVEDEWSWRSPRFMPRWASRLDLLVTAVRIERLQQITARDVYAEGVVAAPELNMGRKEYDKIALETFRDTWDKINSRRGFGWDVNPWVYVIDYKVLADRSSHHV